MNLRLRTLTIALVLAAMSGAAGVAVFLIPNDEIPLVHRVTDLVLHFRAVDVAQRAGFRSPVYDEAPNPDIGIVTIDELSVGNARAGLGAFPFPRRVYGTLLKKLAAAGAKTVVFDIEFIEPSADPADDAAFARGMRRVPTVLAYAVDTTSQGRIGIEFPAPALRRNAAAIGFSTVDAPGGVLVGQPVRIGIGAGGDHAGLTLWSLPAAAMQTWAGHALDTELIPTVDGRTILAAPQVAVLQRKNAGGAGVQTHQVAFAGRGMLSFADAYTARASELRPFAKGAVVFVGATAQGLSDFVQTARSPNTPGLFVNARIADQLMRSMYVVAAPPWFDVALIVTLPLLVALLFTFVRTAAAAAIALGLTAVVAIANMTLFAIEFVWVDLVHVTIAMLAATMLVAIYRVLHEGSQRKLVTALFGTHVSHDVVREILAQEDPKSALALRGKRVKATIFYSDIRGFTALAESMPAEAVYAQLNEYFEAMCEIVLRHGGYVDKFIGDCIMAVFSAPYQRPDDAKRAVVAALEQQRAIEQLSARWRAAGMPAFSVGMGINTGEVVMGNLGARSRMNYTVIGDSVNVAARLYNVAKGGEIVISQATYDEVREVVTASQGDPIAVKGKAAPLNVYRVEGLRSAE